MQEEEDSFHDPPATYLLSHTTSCYQLLKATGLGNGYEKLYI